MQERRSRHLGGNEEASGLPRRGTITELGWTEEEGVMVEQGLKWRRQRPSDDGGRDILGELMQ